MQYIRAYIHGETRWARLEGDTALLLTDAPYLGGVPTGERADAAQLRLACPCTPSKIVAVGKNYFDHIREFDATGELPKNPILFLKPPSSLLDPGAAIVTPPDSARVDYEGELALVIGKTAKNVSEQDAMDVVFGFTCLNDVTARDIQAADGQWTRAKGYDTFCPVGPYLVTDFDASDVLLTTRKNGAVCQQARTSLMMWKIPALLAFITRGITLLPGDIVTTGTPAGIGPMQAGDEVEIDIEGLGILRNTVR